MKKEIINLMIGLLILSSAVAQDKAPTTKTRESSEEQKPAAPGILVDIGGRKLYLHCLGTGAPTVILEAGMGDDSTRWSRVEEIVSKRFRTCAYDRAGSGRSELGPVPRTMRQEVFELHALLEAAKIAPPLILVGHSYGGLLVRLYTAEYPKDVLGLVLVDPTHESTRLYVQRRAKRRGNGSASVRAPKIVLFLRSRR